VVTLGGLLVLLLPPGLRTKAPRLIEARLHTATSSGEVYSRISVHKLEERMTPERGGGGGGRKW